LAFDGLTNIEFPAPSGGTFTYNIADVDAHREEFIKTLTSQIRYPEPSVDFISDTDAAQILDNRPGGIITYYTDTDGRYLGVDASLEATAATKVALYPVWGAVESQATGTSANVSGLLFSVYTALRDITFRSDYGQARQVSVFYKHRINLFIGVFLRIFCLSVRCERTERLQGIHHLCGQDLMLA
jgi:hypothetical protein